jgi:pantoate--beta-alanine ligase
MKLIKSNNSLKNELADLRRQQKKIGFVPTMGALHAGHLSLIEKSIKENDITVISIYVNPTQFNEKSDFDKYPRTIEDDLVKLGELKPDIVFAPEHDNMYPEGFEKISIDLGNVTNVLEGKHRPGHFDGVVTIVKKLFDVVEPHLAYFGQKDFQQYLVIKKMVEYFNLPLTIIRCPIIREKDGLAMSSRNVRLNDSERKIAPVLYQQLLAAKNLLDKMPADEIKEKAKSELKKHSQISFEYFEILDANNLNSINNISEAKEILICVALKIGQIRLIDNILV